MHDLALAYLSKSYVLLVFLLPLNTLAMVSLSIFAQVAVFLCLSLLQLKAGLHLPFRPQLTIG